jgi:hypothetical protein
VTTNDAGVLVGGLSDGTSGRPDAAPTPNPVAGGTRIVEPRREHAPVGARLALWRSGCRYGSNPVAPSPAPKPSANSCSSLDRVPAPSEQTGYPGRWVRPATSRPSRPVGRSWSMIVLWERPHSPGAPTSPPATTSGRTHALRSRRSTPKRRCCPHRGRRATRVPPPTSRRTRRTRARTSPAGSETPVPRSPRRVADRGNLSGRRDVRQG